MTMHRSKGTIHEEIRETLGTVPEWLKEMPEGAQAGFWEMARDFWLTETAIPNKYKELIGLAVASATRCRYCALFHTEAARLFGATDEEIAEASMMSALSMAGSTFIHGQQIDFERFRREVADIVDYVGKQARTTEVSLEPPQHAHP